MKYLSFSPLVFASSLAFAGEVLDLDSSLQLTPPPGIDDAGLVLADVDSKGRVVLGVVTSINPWVLGDLTFCLYGRAGYNTAY